MAFEQLEAALLRLKQDRLKKEAAEARRRSADTAATEQFALIKSSVIAPIFNKAATLLTDDDFFAEIIDQEDDTTHSIALKVDLSTDNDIGPKGSLICRLEQDLKTCQFGMTITQNTEPVFDGKSFKLRELTEEVVARMTEQFLVDLIATVPTKQPTVPTSRGNTA
jgi:hypothetical protein